MGEQHTFSFGCHKSWVFLWNGPLASRHIFSRVSQISGSFHFSPFTQCLSAMALWHQHTFSLVCHRSGKCRMPIRHLPIGSRKKMELDPYLNVCLCRIPLLGTSSTFSSIFLYSPWFFIFFSEMQMDAPLNEFIPFLHGSVCLNGKLNWCAERSYIRM